MLVTSTVGRRKSGPLWTIKTLADGGDTSVCWRWHGKNRSPKVTTAFLDRQRRILLPGQFAREHQNQWIDGADALTAQADVDFAMTRPRIDVRCDTPQVAFIDLGTVHDPSVIAEGCLVDGVAVITSLRTFQGDHEHPVQIADVQQAIRDLAAAGPISKIRIESWQGVQAAQTLQADGLPVELYAATAKRNAEEWPLLVQRLVARTVILPQHARLRDELLNLTTKSARAACA